MAEREVEFQVTAYKTGSGFNFPKKQCQKLGISGGDTVHLIINNGSDQIFSGRKTLKSGTEIYGSDLTKRLPAKSVIQVKASDPIQVQASLEQIATEAQETESGYEKDPEVRRRVELYAMSRAKQELELRGFVEIENTSAIKPYDYICKRDGVRYYVEVKGTRGKGCSLFFTRNEIVHALRYPHSSIAIIVSNIDLSGKGEENRCFVSPWNPDKKDLLPVVYRWDVPNAICNEQMK